MKRSVYLNSTVSFIGFSAMILSNFTVKTKNFHFSLKGVDKVMETYFPDDFILGAGSSAFQTEGAWNISRK